MLVYPIHTEQFKMMVPRIDEAVDIETLYFRDNGKTVSDKWSGEKYKQIIAYIGNAESWYITFILRAEFTEYINSTEELKTALIQALKEGCTAEDLQVKITEN